MAITFAEYQRWFREYDEARNLGDTAPEASLVHLTEEVGEIARHILRLEGYRALDAAARAGEIADLALELSDAFVFLTKLANAYGIDWQETIERAMAKAEARYSVEDGLRVAAERLKRRERHDAMRQEGRDVEDKGG